jgi:hypothetical protein
MRQPEAEVVPTDDGQVHQQPQPFFNQWLTVANRVSFT